MDSQTQGEQNQQHSESQKQENQTILNSEKATEKTQDKEEETNEDGNENEDNQALKGDESVEQYLKDYESLLTYSFKLLNTNKNLMQENLKLRIGSEDIVKRNLNLLQENEQLTNERDKLLADSMTLIQYNDVLQASKDNFEKELFDIKDKFYALLGGMKEMTELEKENLAEFESKTNVKSDKLADTENNEQQEKEKIQ